MLLNVFIAMAGGGGGSQSSGILNLLPLVLIFAVFYFLMLRPQVKRQKEVTRMREALKKGDRVVTTGGIIGTIANINEKENIVIVKVDSNVKLEIQKSAISQMLSEDSK